MKMSAWFTIVFEAMPPTTQGVVEEYADEVDALITTAITTGIESWPELLVDPVQFARWLGARMGTHKEMASLRRWFAYLRPDDLYLACCCASGTSAAIHAFKNHFREDIDLLTRRFEDRTWGTQDLEQILFEKLFVGKRARIVDYAGQGFLQNWLRVTSTRTFIDAKRGQAQQKREDLLTQGLSWEVLGSECGDDVELEFFKQTYQAQFKAAIAQAVQRLEPQQRVLLRQHVVERRGLDKLGALYGIHRATVARHLKQARDALYMHTRQVLLAELKVSDTQLDSILALIRSRLDASIERLLKSDDTP